MSELLDKCTDVSNGLVDIFELIDKEKTKDGIGLQLITSSMKINNHIRQLEDKQGISGYLNKQKEALNEISAIEFLVMLLISSGFITEEKSVSVLQDCAILRELIESGRSDEI